jgi:DNA-binding response OmpR family regulator
VGIHGKTEMKMKMMLIGSEEVTQKLSRSLAKEGIEARSTSDRPQAMALLKQERFDLAAVDGLADEAEVTCRYISERGGIPVVLLMTHGGPDWESLESLDIDGFIPDGVGDAELAARLRAVLRRRSVTVA